MRPRISFRSKTLLTGAAALCISLLTMAQPAAACDLKAPTGGNPSTPAPNSQVDRKEFHFTLGIDSGVMLSNRFGNITVRPSTGRQVVIVAIIHGPKDMVEVDSHQHPKSQRIEIDTHVIKSGGDETQVDYEIQMPADASLNIECGSGEIHVDGIKGNIHIESESAAVTVRNIQNGNVQVKNVNGLVSLSNIKFTRVDVTSIEGAVDLYSVSGKSINVNTTSGKISYTGNFLGGGTYSFRNRDGDMDIFIPTDASIEINASSKKGSVESDFPLEPIRRSFNSTGTPIIKGSRTLVGTSQAGDSKVELHSFSGKIRVKKQ